MKSDNYQEQLTNARLNQDSKLEISSLREGIWSVKKIPNGKQATFLLDKIEELPEALTLAQLEDMRYLISKSITDTFIAYDILEDIKLSGLTIKKIVYDIFLKIKQERK